MAVFLLENTKKMQVRGTIPPEIVVLKLVDNCQITC